MTARQYPAPWTSAGTPPAGAPGCRAAPSIPRRRGGVLVRRHCVMSSFADIVAMSLFPDTAAMSLLLDIMTMSAIDDIMQGRPPWLPLEGCRHGH